MQSELNRILDIVKRSTDIMIEKNSQRGNASRQIGLLGLFLEVRTMYLRLRHLVWDTDPDNRKENWMSDVKNALQDLRNYTILAEIALQDGNFKGSNDSFLKEK
jgi:hypothetical protein